MIPLHPIAYSERSAARAMYMAQAKFRRLVDMGALPKPTILPDGTELRYKPTLDAVFTGQAARPREDFE